MSISAVSFGQRPYGYDPKKGEFTSEQAMKDFKPGIYDPAARERAAKRKKNIVKGLIATAGIAGIAFFLTKGKGIDKIKQLYNGVKGEGIADALKNIKNKGGEKIKNAGEYVVEKSKDAYNKVTELFAQLKKRVQNERLLQKIEKAPKKGANLNEISKTGIDIKRIQNEISWQEFENAPKKGDTFDGIFKFRKAEKEAAEKAARFADYDKAAAEAGIDIF